MSLQQQIEEEMQQEARIDIKIEGIKRRFLKQQANRKYRFVPSKKDADAMLVFNRKDLSSYSFILNKDWTEDLMLLADHGNFTIVYLKNKNPRDSKNSTLGDIKNIASRKKFYE